MTKVAIVILNWNGKHFLEQFLGKLIDSCPTAWSEVVIADNDSTDDSMSFLAQNYPHIRTIQFDKNYGFTGGYNKALQQIEADYYVLLNSDVETTENWLQPLVEFMDTHPEYAAVQPKIKSFAQKDYFEYAGAAGGFIDQFGYPFCRGRILDTVEKDTGQYNDICDIFWATGACLFIRSKDWHEMSGLDDNFFAHMEEIDLCWRLQNKGRKIAYIPQSTVYHVGGGTLPNDSPFKLFLNHRNNLFLLHKNLPLKSYFKIMFFRKILDGVSALLYITQGKFYGISTVLKAHFEFYRTKKKLKRERNIEAFPETVLKKLIIWEYFVKKNKTFDNLDFVSSKFRKKH